jgi:hypothetical protein
MREAQRRDLETKLLGRIKSNLPALEELLSEVDDAEEDLVYRFYHQSYKVFRLQEYTAQIVKTLGALLPEVSLNDWFTMIVAEGTGRNFTHDDNERWIEVTRPMLEAFWHARYVLAMRRATGSSWTPQIMPFRVGGSLVSVWTAVRMAVQPRETDPSHGGTHERYPRQHPP